jgi:branched-chain amino acid transport system substrate-binding protein
MRRAAGAEPLLPAAGFAAFMFGGRMESNLEARCSVRTARDLELVAHPTVRGTWKLNGFIEVGPDREDAGQAVTVGFLSDMPTGSLLAEYLDPIVLALEDSVREGRLKRPVRIAASHVRGLPTGDADDVVAAYRDLMAEGCSLVLSTGVTNNALVLRDHINAAEVPYITMAGTTRFTGRYCFSLANGGHGEEAAILAAYLADRGYRRVAVMGEQSPGDLEYREFFAEQAALYGVETVASYYFGDEPADTEVDRVLRAFRESEPDALAYCGFGFHSRTLNPALSRVGWEPPKVMNAAIMWALTSPEWAAALDGWIGIEQTNNDHDLAEKNPNWTAMLERYESRFAARPDDTMTALLYDQGRAAAESIINCSSLDGPGLARGLERIKMMPSTLGGPRTYIGFGPEDHRGYRGDFMFMKQLRSGKFYFDSYHWPKWPANKA